MKKRLLILVALMAMVIVIILASRSPTRSSAGSTRMVASEATMLGAWAHAAAAPTKDSAEKPPLDAGRNGRIERYQELRVRLTRAQDERLRAEHELRSRAEDEESQAALRPRRAAGSLAPDYIREQIQDVTPLIRECYDAALSTDPDLGGRVTVEMKLIGEEEIGGLIESSVVLAEESDVATPDFLECVSETMYAVELDAPEGGGAVTIRYPFHFRAEPTDD